MKKLGVEAVFNCEVTLDMVKAQKPDVIIAATGALPVIPEKIPGIHRENVVTAHDVLEGKAWTNQPVHRSGEPDGLPGKRAGKLYCYRL